ncbi:uncharacterized protein LOC129601779 isoform X3 [Paramacrobiotus metropolitanus]|uniref:uncharacterized protein LOC129601779 isoform X3 n=1 Tax=Paramacrobiotus metropolitanus TaxID=2943436 RepID=UPI002446590F|nr:uncharacterized protein LOC129601779 isoform X3 [Paramacrobiotus metropolitanus]XP_055356640.1 uncharacterized protein LOC129601779 isoform X3 [Paramacrobiotus metropolitanus]XP_055356642.1 uncharacterized protein LOC129601779 isoform X3 [Paramacrobiotus metropolitanus]
MMELDLEFQLQVGYEPWPYRRSGRSVSSGNTVMVQLHDAWYLGFIEDIADDQQQIFVNFRCTALPAAWLPAHCVFPHALFTETGGSLHTVLGALRSDPDAPLLFQSAAVVGVCSGHGLMCCVQTPAEAGSQRHLLHPLHMAAEQPPRRTVLQPPALPYEGVYTAYTTDTLDVSHVHCIDENRLQFQMRCAVYAAQCRALNGRPRKRFGRTPDTRYHMRLDRDSVRFLIWRRQEDDCPWSAEMLSECVRRCLHNGVLTNDSLDRGITPPDCCSTVALEDGGGLTRLPLEIVDSLLDVLDVVTRTRIQRVSPAWHDVATRCRSGHRQCVLDFGLNVRSANKADEMHRLGRLVYHGLSPGVRTLVLSRWRPAEHRLAERSLRLGSSDVTVIRQLVRMLRPAPAAALQRIICHRCVVSGELPSQWSSDCAWRASADRPTFFPLHHLSPLMDVCSGQLILVDYVQNDTVQAFHHCRPFCHSDWSPLTDEPYQSRDPAPPLRVTVPFLRLDCGQDAVAVLTSMRTAMEAALPEPPAEMRRMATDMYEYWRTRDTYWPFLRHLLTATEPGGPAWENADFPSTPLPQLTV